MSTPNVAYVEEYKIVDGPSKWDLMLALFDSRGGSRFVEMRTTRGSSKNVTRRHLVIHTLQQEDGSGNNWNFEGYLVDEEPLNRYAAQISGFYSIHKRKGSLKIHIR